MERYASLTLIAYYIRCFALIFCHRCKPIFQYFDFVQRQLSNTNCSQEMLFELEKCFESFDEIIKLKNRLSNIFGVQLLLNSAFDLIMLIISVYGMLYYIIFRIT